MILKSKGKLAEGLYAVGVAEIPAYLTVGKTPALFDAGMTFLGPSLPRRNKRHSG